MKKTTLIIILPILIASSMLILLGLHSRIYALGVSPSCACVPSSSCYCSEGTTFEGTCPDTQNYIHCTEQTCSSCLIGAPPLCTPIVECGPCSRNVDSTYFNGTYHTCCTSGAGCDDCDPPKCSTGYTTTNPGNYCSTLYRNDKSCSNGTDECGDSCGTNTRKCYLIETNITNPETPESVSIIVDGKTYLLSTDPNNPTHIKLPAKGSSNVKVSVPTFVAPLTSRGAGYFFKANNYGINNEWKAWVSCSGTVGEDFCTKLPNANHIQDFVPSSLPVGQVLKENAVGKISAMYTTTDKCSDTYKYSTAVEGYYIVDTRPVEPPIIDPEDIIPEILTDTTTKGCSSTTYTGKEINNPLHIVASVTDENGLDEIRAFTFWFSKDNTIPTTGIIAASYTGSINTDLGIMIRKNGTGWSNPRIYATNASQDWGLVTDGYIKINNNNAIRIYDINVTQSSDVLFDYKLEFLENPSNLFRMYNIYGGALDYFMINGNVIDQSYFFKFFNWGIDLGDPTAEDLIQQIVDPANTNITWSVNDDTSGVGRTVINGYRIAGTVTDQATLYDKDGVSKGAKTLISPIPNDSLIGLYKDTNAWRFWENNTGETDKLYIGNNENGGIALYLTTYDKACNTNGTNDSIDLNSWLATRGGAVYSRGNISTSAKDVSSSNELLGVFNIKTAMTREKIDIGTELLATRNSSISNLVHTTSGASRAVGVEDTNNSTGYWYNELSRKLDKYKGGLTKFGENGIISTRVSNVCTTGANCYMFTTGNIAIPSGYICDKPTLFMTEGDINIEPNVTSGTGLNGCIFVAGGNINIGAGTYKSIPTKIRYDFIEGYLIAENQIIFTLADQAQNMRDGIEIFGGMIGFGSEVPSGESGISIKRSMRLYSQINPVVVLTYDNKYSNISTIFFGTEYQLYKQEVGFKSY